ncbi:unnamed protein product [Vitrella brassicaformis CCMP3155]|uniref:Ribosomal protein S16 n=2 Tax=Vitrella brassicaformis TaxID=1169539 RepID=A0A0G4G4F6_VITBC|nr:unnamed protein product [Vitrella brassicaformis CCMP3155]|eukprot:CEM23138.1 unnamed protein product [Vitrella brassicaformis CCMP3155]
MFLPYYSKKNGPPVIRNQIQGVRRHRFLRMVACNIRDKRDGKHMEVLGTHIIQKKDLSQELRLRFSRVKFWLGVNAHLTKSAARMLGMAGLIPPLPPRFGRRTYGHFAYLAEVEQQWAKERHSVLQDYYVHPRTVERVRERVVGEDGGEKDVQRETIRLPR